MKSLFYGLSRLCAERHNIYYIMHERGLCLCAWSALILTRTTRAMHNFINAMPHVCWRERLKQTATFWPTGKTDISDNIICAALTRLPPPHWCKQRHSRCLNIQKENFTQHPHYPLVWAPTLFRNDEKAKFCRERHLETMYRTLTGPWQHSHNSCVIMPNSIKANEAIPQSQ